MVITDPRTVSQVMKEDTRSSCAWHVTDEDRFRETEEDRVNI